MHFKLSLLAFFFVVFVFPLSVSAQADNAGFLPGNIWYSKDPFLAGDKIFIHTLVFNSGTAMLTGIVEFYDSNTLLGKKEVSVGPSGQSADVSVPWTVTEGHHTIYALLKNASVANNRTDESEKFVAALTFASSSSSAQQYAAQKFGETLDYAEKNLPAPVTAVVKNLAAQSEGLRVEGKAWVDEQSIALNARINDLNDPDKREAERKAQAARGEIPVTEKFMAQAEKPLTYLGIFLTEAASVIFGSALFFYGALLIVLWFTLRFVKRVFFF